MVLKANASALFESEVARSSADANSLVAKWSPVFSRVQVPPKRKALVARLWENQKTINNPKHKMQSGLLLETMTTTNDVADFTKASLPVIAKAYSKIVSPDLIGTQPMTGPSQMIFYMRNRYGTTKGKTVAGTQIMRQNTAGKYGNSNGWAIDPYYSSRQVFHEPLTMTTGRTVAEGVLRHRPVLAGTVIVEIYESEAATNVSPDDLNPILSVVFGPDGQLLTVHQGDGFANTDAPFDVVTTPGATEFNHTTGAVQVTLDGAADADVFAVVNYEYDMEGNPLTPELTMSIDSDNMTASDRRLKTSWSLNVAQDMMAVYSLDPKTIFEGLLVDEMTAEIDREILNLAMVIAAIRANHNFATGAGASVNFTDRNIALWHKTLEAANIIHQTTLAGPANWAVCSSDISSKYEELADFRSDDALNPEGQKVGIVKTGNVSSKMDFYKDPLFPRTKVLVGFKGRNEFETGIVYGPYVPIVLTPEIYNPNSFDPSMGSMTRYGLKALEDSGYYYGVITVTNI